MQQVISNITLDTSGKANKNVIRAKQGDRSSRFIRATIVDGDEPVIFGENDTVQIDFLRIDNIKRTFDGNIDGDGNVFFAIPSWCLELPYRVRGYIKLPSSNNDETENYTPPFFIEVGEAVVSSIENN